MIKTDDIITRLSDGAKGRVIKVMPHTVIVRWFADGIDEEIAISDIPVKYEHKPSCEMLADLLERILGVPVREYISRANFDYAVENSIPKNWLWEFSVYNPDFPASNTMPEIAFRWFMFNHLKEFSSKISFC